MQVRATKRGYDSDACQLREIGDEFTIQSDECPSWCEKVEDKPKAEEKPRGGGGSGRGRSAES